MHIARTIPFLIYGGNDFYEYILIPHNLPLPGVEPEIYVVDTAQPSEIKRDTSAFSVHLIITGDTVANSRLISSDVSGKRNGIIATLSYFYAIGIFPDYPIFGRFPLTQFT